MAYTVTEIGTITVEEGGGFAGNWGSGWSSSNYLHIEDLDTPGSAKLHGFVVFYKGQQSDTNTTDVAIPLFGDKDNTGGITLGIDNGYVAVSDGTTVTRGTTQINDDLWQSIVFSVGDTTIKAYVNGTLEVDVTPSATLMNSMVINAIGNAASATAWPSGLDGIQIYDTYLFDFMVADYEANIYPGGGFEDPINNISGLIARYTPDSFNTSTGVWADTINSYNASTYRGTVGVRETTGDGTFQTLYGSTNDGLRFPSGILPSTYTLFHVSRYADGAEFRIVTGYGGNWLSGHWGGNSGVAYHNGWMTPQTDYNGTAWRIYADQKSYFRDSGIERGTGGGTSTNLSINAGDYTEYSDWEVAEVIVFNRELSVAEIEIVENALAYYYPTAGLTYSAPADSSNSSAANFLTEIPIIQESPYDTTSEYIDSDFPNIVVTPIIVRGFEEDTQLEPVQTINTMNQVYNLQNLSNEEDKMPHRAKVVKIFFQDKITKEKWS